jgi:hypothetical protein
MLNQLSVAWFVANIMYFLEFQLMLKLILKSHLSASGLMVALVWWSAVLSILK